MEELELTPLDAAMQRAYEFGDSITQASVWAMAVEKLNALEGSTAPEDIAQRFVVENFVTELVRTIPETIVGEA